MNYYNAGYIIISYENELIYKGCTLQGLSDTIVSISNLVRPTFPDYWFFPWCNKSENNTISNLINSRLKISLDEHVKAQSFLETLIQEKIFSWPNVFKCLKDAMYFKECYLKGLKNLSIVSLSLSEEYQKDFLLNEEQENDFDVSIYDLLKDSRPFQIEDNEVLGFDICGYSNNAFYSFICNGLQSDFKRFGKQLNSLSLIENYKDAQEIIHLIDQGEIRAEEILWYPWLVTKCKEMHCVS
ncbi:TPA: hypothetical protein ROX88_000750 [Bacillus pseudomycoides]|nr:hypothetical protein [Bacillus pseudomycoides]